ncbi:hypothetical protein FNF27_03901 [Cafeteria roenbergensis]|uniref:EamA domain-containing protein n=1 Tax=Cafeteria roenbergensis TaxID=33653 RepID=A0A5A8ECQ8_CAFRO|nr:hypothetical protein FNF27_03901 [Cafeteria roenbergensis]
MAGTKGSRDGTDGEVASLLAGKAAPSAGAAAAAAGQADPSILCCSRSHAIGAVLLVMVSIIWTSASVLVQYIMKTRGFDRPFFLTYVSNALFSLLLVAELTRSRIATQSKSLASWAHPADGSWRREARAAMFLSVIWFAAQETYNASLDGTTVSVSTILSSTSSVFTLMLSIGFLGESLSFLISAGVITAVAGAVVTALASQTASQGSSTPLGICLALASAFLYGAYTVTLRKAAPETESVPFNLRVLFGFVGLFNLLLLGPVVAILHATGVEDLGALTWELLGLIICKGLVDNVLADLLWAQAVLLTSPTAATVGLSLTVPLAMIADMITPGILPSGIMIGGALLVVAGFLITTLAPTPRRSGAESDDTTSDGNGLGDDTDAVSDVDNALGALATRSNLGSLPAPSPLSEDGGERAPRHAAVSL